MTSDNLFKNGLCTKPRYQYLDWTSDDPKVENQCRSICDQCPIKKECAQTALENSEPWGVWGGMEEFRVRRALGIDSFENKRIRMRDLICPFCESSDLDITKKREYAGYPVQCNECHLEWYSHRYPMKMRKALRREQERLNDNNMATGLEPSPE